MGASTARYLPEAAIASVLTKMGAGEHRGIRRRSRQRDDLRAIGRWAQSQSADGVADGEGRVPRGIVQSGSHLRLMTRELASDHAGRLLTHFNLKKATLTRGGPSRRAYCCSWHSTVRSTSAYGLPDACLSSRDSTIRREQQVRGNYASLRGMTKALRLPD
jgi:hypothetical protein